MSDPKDDELGPGPIPQRMITYTAISDLFVAMNHESAKLYDGTGKFRGYEPEELRSTALFFLENLLLLGVREVPTVETLITDFYERMPQ
jgi:hypothetical protein